MENKLTQKFPKTIIVWYIHATHTHNRFIDHLHNLIFNKKNGSKLFS